MLERATELNQWWEQKRTGIPFTFCVPVCYSIGEMLEARPTHHVVGLSAVLVGALLAWGGLATVWAAGANEAGAALPGISLQQVHMIETREGAKLWEVRAQQAEVNEREGVTVLTRGVKPIEIAFYSSQGQATCVANRATLDLKTKDVRLDGSVVARSDQGMELKTEQLRWIAASRRLQTDQPVTITRGTLVSRGRGMEAETDLERVRIFQNITSQLGPTPAVGRRSPPR